MEGTPAWRRLELMARHYWEVRPALTLLDLRRDLTLTQQAVPEAEGSKILIRTTKLFYSYR